MNQAIIAALSAVLGIVLFRFLTKKHADHGQRILDITTAVNDEKEKNLRDKQAEITARENQQVGALEQEKERNLNAEELADWFNSRNKSNK